jgi:DnaK suppressor protein
MAIDEKLLATIKEALIKEKSALEESLGRIAKPIDQLHGDYKATFEDIGSDRDDNTTETEQYTDNLPVEITLEKKLQAIIDALDKIEAGTYGICEKCHQEINHERLLANPGAKTCVSCD